MSANLQIVNGTKSANIQDYLIKAAADLIDEENPNYQIVAARLLNQKIRKEVYGQWKPKPLLEMIKRNCDAGFYDGKYLLKPDGTKVSEEELDSTIKTNLSSIGATEKDYYFLILNKSDSADVFINTLKGLDTLQPNGNNLPFQCKWDNNKVFRERSFQDAVDFIMTNLGQSIRLRSEIYLNFKEHFSNYV